MRSIIIFIIIIINGLESRDTAVGICHSDHVAPSSRKSWH
jgi:hypothetical protein